MLRCDTVEESLDALRDGALGPEEAEEVRQHLARCGTCAAEWDVTERLREAIRDRASAPPAPAAFRKAIVRLLEPQPARVSWVAKLQEGIRLRPLAAMAVAVVVAMLVVLPLNLQLWSTKEVVTALVGESVNEHIRQTLREGLPEIPSRELQPVQDRHQRRLEFSGPLSFPDDVEFQLIGGQVSYLLRRKALAVTYRKAARPITLLVLPSSGIQLPAPPPIIGAQVYRATDRGFQTVHWQQGPLIYSLVSDLDQADLARLAEKLQQK
jgi:anti-sigma factor (TIGR02949 family)